MSNANGMIYCEPGVDPKIGVSVRDVQCVLGTSESYVNALCRHQNLNKWAKYKPIRYDTKGLLTYQQRKNRYFGLEVPFCDNRYRMNETVYQVVYLNNLEAGWSYLKPQGDRRPQGGYAEFFRLTDFVRNPGELNQAANEQQGDLTPVALKGYNQRADLPISITLNMDGMRALVDANNRLYYEINTQEKSDLVFTITNNPNADIKLQELVQMNTDTATMCWRPVLQVYADAYDLYGRTNWYDLDRAPFYEVSGDRITTDGSSWSITLPLTTGIFRNDANVFYHLCIGIGKCTKGAGSSNIQWYGEIADYKFPLFVVPYKDVQEGGAPIHYMFSVVNYTDMSIKVPWFMYPVGNTVYPDAGTLNYFTVPWYASGTIYFLSLNIPRSENKTLKFVGPNAPNESTNEMATLKLRIDVERNGSSSGLQTPIYLYPQTSGNQNPNEGYILISPSSPATLATIYAKAVGSDGTTAYGDLSEIGAGQTFVYRFKASIGGAAYTDAGEFSIHKTSNS